ncbi:aminotransferase class I/II-fold pyridoxal phosphate-dependent enzyme [Chromobacterium violaceum]|uniref:8-amino-7-oxononanoate synthase family protein n=1 Tax=Chromobacterium violaceum TaxID=536 RepID=UPI0009DA734E|nr:aminotransferase class I/II-fold pyridoxal phosphate-dependent enzyme [Chromobacterium violaceum]MBX9269770.1 aminotransferase class I/II-fold pyridoxal phosphate-dependent enzyme [Chromobacterium violaceum]OQS50648.1 aminotransferase class I and II [Chromobacterium violaceum]OQS52833.1 aminotransferase class I and II [Chromobacterium violaceum]QRO31692.1 aminotransferase class I/II-fold pyridoxal phosphate-dependent enzyme [Chromobacterium violaceum]QRQ18508.1 aminotransferase class I/II-f
MHQYTNIKKAIQLSNSFWDVTTAAGMANIATRNLGNGRHEAVASGRQFTNMSSYSYLGLDSHPAILRAAADAVLNTGSLNTSISRIRVQFDILQQAEEALASLVDAETLTVPSCAAAAAATLPLLASGALTGDVAPLMVFDKNAHFCLNMMKPICADETEIQTIRHNDLNALEDLCKTHQRVAYVADGVYSTGGMAPVKELLALQDKYGLFLFFDEAHGLSTLGHLGRGLVLEEMGAINDRTLIVTSLNKGFGASGGAIFLGPRGDAERRKLATRFGGPVTWSQRINTAGLGAIIESVAVHKSAELPALQQKLQDNIRLFDQHVASENSGDRLPIRFVSIGSEERTILYAKSLLEDGYYTSPIFFPVIAKGRAGLRIMIRANMTTEEIERFGACLKQLRASHE